MLTQKSVQTWSNTFPNEINNIQQSTKFMKRSIIIAISSILYMRNIYPEDRFMDKVIDGLTLKILKDQPEEYSIINCFKGIFDAIEKKFLKNVILGFKKDETESDGYVEAYSFKFCYNENMMTTISNHDGENLSFSSDINDTKKMTISLFKNLLSCGHTLKPLPDKPIVDIKLFYYDEVTPLDYEPLGFCPAENCEFQIEKDGNCYNYKIGRTSTKFFSMTLKMIASSNKFREDFCVTTLSTQNTQDADMQDENRSNSLSDIGVSKKVMLINDRKCKRSSHSALMKLGADPVAKKKMQLKKSKVERNY